MSKTTPNLDSLGDYLRSVRESCGFSMRQAAKAAGISSAYLSQIEGGKRGKRKSEDDHFGPHPQILKRLAEVYHLPASELMKRAGYLDDDKSDSGFSEEREIERVFDFVIRDPVFRKALTALDKRAIVNRYEGITGKRLITWAGDSNHPTATKSDFTKIQLYGDHLFTETPYANLTIDEVAQEFGCERERVEKWIKNHWLHATKDAAGNWLVDKEEIRQFKDYAIWDGLKLREIVTHSHKPITSEDYAEVAKKIEEVRSDEALTELERLSKASVPKGMTKQEIANSLDTLKLAKKYKAKI